MPPERHLPAAGWLLASWRDSRALIPLLAAAAIATGAGWAIAAAFVAVTLASGHPITLVAAAVNSTGFVLPALDALTALASVAIRASRPSVVRVPAHATPMPAGSTRHSPRRSPAVLAFLRALRRICAPAQFASLPRPVCWALASAWWASLTLFTWLTAWVFWPHGGFALADAAASARGQQFAAAAWMMHLVCWSLLACKHLNRNRATASNWSTMITT